MPGWGWRGRVGHPPDCAVPLRLSPKHREDGPKGSSARSSRSPSSSSPRRSASPHQNGHKGSAQNGRHSHGAALEEPPDVRRLFLHHGSLPSPLPPLPPPSAGPPPPGSPLPSFPTHPAAIWGALVASGSGRWMGAPGAARPPPRPFSGCTMSPPPWGVPAPLTRPVRGCHTPGCPRWLSRVTTRLSAALGVD